MNLPPGQRNHWISVGLVHKGRTFLKYRTWRGRAESLLSVVRPTLQRKEMGRGSCCARSVSPSKLINQIGYSPPQCYANNTASAQWKEYWTSRGSIAPPSLPFPLTKSFFRLMGRPKVSAVEKDMVPLSNPHFGTKQIKHSHYQAEKCSLGGRGQRGE